MMLGATGSATADYESFYGVYAGRGVANTAGELSDRDLSVEIGPAQEGDGFTVAWTTAATSPDDGAIQRKAYRVRFIPTQRKGVYSSAMRMNMFGRPVPLDPMNGDPYVWAVIEGDTLKVYALLITDGFGYEMQVYARTLIKDGLEVTFSRVRDGERLRDVHAKLVRLPR